MMERSCIIYRGLALEKKVSKTMTLFSIALRHLGMDAQKLITMYLLIYLAPSQRMRVEAVLFGL